VARGFRLTEKGELLLQASRGLLLQIEQFRQQANGVAGRLLGSVRIGLAENQDSSVTLRIAQAIARFRQRDEAVQLELISAPPAELERLLLEQRLDCAISYFSGNQAAFDYQPLFDERQRLYCGAGHALFGAVDVSRAAAGGRPGAPPLSLSQAGRAVPEPPQHGGGGADRQRADAHSVGPAYRLPALPLRRAWEAQGLLRALDTGLDFIVPFTLARHRGQVPGEAQRAFAEDLLAVFG
jgi:DNA-binding transcriptional LysR family regulator